MSPSLYFYIVYVNIKNVKFFYFPFILLRRTLTLNKNLCFLIRIKKNFLRQIFSKVSIKLKTTFVGRIKKKDLVTISIANEEYELVDRNDPESEIISTNTNPHNTLGHLKQIGVFVIVSSGT